MPGRTAVDRGRDVRLQLLSTAAELIGELGWNAVSTRILAERAGVTPGLVHYHFPSLQALLRDADLLELWLRRIVLRLATLPGVDRYIGTALVGKSSASLEQLSGGLVTAASTRMLGTGLHR